MPQTPDFTRTSSLLKLGDHPTWRRAATGITQTLETVELGGIETALDGTSVFIGLDDMPEKFTSTINCDDWFPPELEALKRGMEIDVECIFWLGRRGIMTPEGFKHRHAPGSIVYMDKGSKGLPGDGEGGFQDDQGRITFPGQVEWTKYRPTIRFMVVSYSLTANEWGATTSWTLNLVSQPSRPAA